MAGKIIGIVSGSIAEEIGIETGDILLSINGAEISDLIDYNFYCNEDYLELEVKKASGEIWLCELDKYPDEELGLVFSSGVFDGIRSCRNHCLFCFIDQLQPKPRRSMLVRDDDYRMSFLEGNFVTCTNMTEEDYQRIAKMHLSPLYISVHTVDPILRQKLLGRKQPAEILLTLQRLISMGCTIHAQVVLCPEINDGPYLTQTVDSLYELYPGVASLAVVPVGLTRFQQSPQLRLFTPKEAGQVIDFIELRQQRFLKKSGVPFVFAADELYVKAERPFPAADLYGDFAQIENGIGMAALFAERFVEAKASIPRVPPPQRVAVVTGYNGARVLRPVLAEINRICRGAIELIEVENKFYGSMITATGLLTGTCLLAAIPPGHYEKLVLPSCMLKFDEDIFLDNKSVAEVSQKLKTKIQISETDPLSLIAAIFADQEERA